MPKIKLNHVFIKSKTGKRIPMIVDVPEENMQSFKKAHELGRTAGKRLKAMFNKSKS